MPCISTKDAISIYLFNPKWVILDRVKTLQSFILRTPKFRDFTINYNNYMAICTYLKIYLTMSDIRQWKSAHWVNVSVNT